jgi:hypothetical protein
MAYLQSEICICCTCAGLYGAEGRFLYIQTIFPSYRVFSVEEKGAKKCDLAPNAPQ